MLLTAAVMAQPTGRVAAGELPPPPPADPTTVPLPGAAWLALGGIGLGYRYFTRNRKKDVL